MIQRLDRQVEERRIGRDTDTVTDVYPLAVTRQSENKKMATERKWVKENAYRPHRKDSGARGQSYYLPPPDA